MFWQRATCFISNAWSIAHSITAYFGNFDWSRGARVM
jgi:hypothetical protein